MDCLAIHWDNYVYKAEVKVLLNKIKYPDEPIFGEKNRSKSVSQQVLCIKSKI